MDPIKPIPNLADQIEDVLARVERAGLRVGRLNHALDLDVPPSCLDTREGLAAFREMLPSVRVVFRAGGWGRLLPLARLWLAYCLCRAVPSLSVRESWKLVRAK